MLSDFPALDLADDVNILVYIFSILTHVRGLPLFSTLSVRKGTVILAKTD